MFLGFSCGSAGKKSACNAGNLGWILGLGRSPEEEKGYPCQYFVLGNSIYCVVYGVSRSWTRLSNFHFHRVKGFSIVNEAEVDVFLEFSCFFYDPMDADNLISGSSAFSKSSLNVWMFLVHVLLKPCLENFEYYFASM